MMWVCRRKAGFKSKSPRTEDSTVRLQGAEIKGEQANPDGSSAFVHVDGAE